MKNLKFVPEKTGINFYGNLVSRSAKWNFISTHSLCQSKPEYILNPVTIEYHATYRKARLMINASTRQLYAEAELHPVAVHHVSTI